MSGIGASHLARWLNLERILGVLHITLALMMVFRPDFLTLVAIEYQLEITGLSALFRAYFIICGVGLLVFAPRRWGWFFVLTAPVGVLGILQLAFGFINPSASFVPGSIGVFCFVMIQYTHTLQEVVRKWMQNSETS